MKQSGLEQAVRLTKLLQVIAMSLPILFGGRRWGSGTERLSAAVVFLLLYVTYGRIYDAFAISYVRLSELMDRQILSGCLSDVVLAVLLCLFGRRTVPVLLFVFLGVWQLVCTVLWSVLVHRWYFRCFPAKKSMLVYEVRAGFDGLLQKAELQKTFQIRRIVQVKECLRDLHCLDGCECVFVSGVHSHDRNRLLKYCMLHGISVYLIPRIGDTILSSAEQVHMLHLPILRVSRYQPSLEYAVAKRAFDIAVSLCALVVLSPMFLLIACLIKYQDGGSVFYRQQRCTKNGRIFWIHKFRTMREDAERDGVARLSSGEGDERVTPIGHFLRRHRMDELPQLFDVLSGNLSLVGPRPERPEIAKHYEQMLPEFALRLEAKAGVTGYAQVYGQYGTPPYDKLQMDLLYLAHASAAEDLKLLFATLKILLFPEP